MNPLIQLFYDLGCDLTITPTTPYECFLLALKFLAVLVILVMFLKFIFKIMCNMLGGKW